MSIFEKTIHHHQLMEIIFFFYNNFLSIKPIVFPLLMFAMVGSAWFVKFLTALQQFLFIFL